MEIRRENKKMKELILGGKRKVTATCKGKVIFCILVEERKFVVFILGNTSFSSYMVKKKVSPRAVDSTRSDLDFDLVND